MIDFLPIRARLDRAEANLDGLDQAVREFVEEDGASSAIVDRYDVVDESHTAVFKEQRPIPRAEWGMILGGIVEDLRGALDYLVTSLVLEAGGRVHVAHQFPIMNSKHEWKMQVVRPLAKSPPRLGYLDFVDKAHVAQIKALQPYKAASGLPSLLLLRRFSDINRNRLISAERFRADPQPTVESVVRLPLTTKSVAYPSPEAALEDGAELVSYMPDMGRLIEGLRSGTIVPSHAEVNVHVELRTTINFGEPGLEDASLHDVRGCMTDVRVKVVDHFERLVQGAPPEEETAVSAEASGS